MGLRGEISLEKSICSAFPKGIPQRKGHLDRESAVQTAPRTGSYHVEMSGFKMYWFKAPPCSNNPVLSRRAHTPSLEL